MLKSDLHVQKTHPRLCPLPIWEYSKELTFETAYITLFITVIEICGSHSYLRQYTSREAFLAVNNTQKCQQIRGTNVAEQLKILLAADCFNSLFLLTSYLGYFLQGTLTEGECSVQLTSSIG